MRGGFDCVRCWKEARDRDEVGPFTRVMQLCPTCGNKRCPKASDHRHDCTGSNEPGQPGSIYAAHPTHTNNRAESL